MNFVVKLPFFNPNIIDLGFIQIKWYSLAYIIGIILAWKLLKYLNKKYKLDLYKDENQFCDDFFCYGILGIILGGRIIYVLFYNLKYFLSNPTEIIAIWHGGMSFHGGFIGVIIASVLLCKKYNINFFLFTDVLSVIVPIGLFLGRIANFINLELYGRKTNGKWGFIFATADSFPRHPSQLYEAFLEGILLFLIMLVVIKKYKFKKISMNSSLFLMFYGIFRIFIEYFREPDIQLGFIFNNITMGQVLSLPLIFVGLFILFRNVLIKKNI